jgi:DNA-binding LacI/PurR family transcriptional regulator
MNTVTQSERSSRSLGSLPSQVAQTLRERIRQGYYAPGDRLPSERVLEQDLNVDRRAIATAIAQMISEGLVERRPNCRPIVTSVRTARRCETSGVQRLPASQLIALIMSRESGVNCSHAQQRVFWGLNEGLIGSGIHCVFLDAGDRSSAEYPHKAEREAEQLTYALDFGFGGVVLYPHDSSSNRQLIEKISLRLPLVLLDRWIPGVHADFVEADDRRTTFEATLRLIERGHRRVALLVSGENVQNRLQGYREALHQALPVEPYEMVLTLPSTRSKSWPVLNAICGLPDDERPTAIICLSSHEALDVARCLEAREIVVLEHLSKISMDYVRGALPGGVGLSAIVPSLEEIGKISASLIIRRYHDPSTPFVNIELPTRVVACAVH